MLWANLTKNVNQRLVSHLHTTFQGKIVIENYKYLIFFLYNIQCRKNDYMPLILKLVTLICCLLLTNQR